MPDGSPFDHAARLAAVRREMAARGVDCLLLSVGHDLPYLTGYRAMDLERLTVLVVAGSATLVVPRLEAPRVPPGPFELRPWDEEEDPVAIVAGLAGSPEVAAVGERTWSVFLLSLQERLPGTRFVPAGAVTGNLRLRKGPQEVAALRRVAQAADRVLERLPGIGFGGRREIDVARDVVELMLEEGHDEALFHIVGSGPNAASPHHDAGKRVIHPGDAVVVDLGGRAGGYCSDVTRTFAVGEPDEELVRVHDVVRRAQEAALATIRPGVVAEAVDAAARGVIEAAGYGPFFIHRLGHGIGLEEHEPPYLVAGNRMPLEPGMAFSVEPGVYLPGRLGVRIEDIVVVTGDGADVLNGVGRGLVVVA